MTNEKTLDNVEQSTFWIPKERYYLRVKTGFTETQFVGNLKHLVKEVDKNTELGVTYEIEVITLDSIGVNSRIRSYKKSVLTYLERMQKDEEYKLNNMIK